jgi:prepilin-type processing-associated H-X9-DG protein
LHGEFGGSPIGWLHSAGYGYNVIGSTAVDGRGLSGHWWLHELNDPQQVEVWTPTRENEVRVPSDMIGFGDATFWPSKDLASLGSSSILGILRLNFAVVQQDCYNAVLRGLPAADPVVQAMKQRHGGRWNIGFCDAHIESLLPKSLFDVSNPVVAQRWNNDHEPHLDEWRPPPAP